MGFPDGANITTSSLKALCEPTVETPLLVGKNRHELDFFYKLGKRNPNSLFASPASLWESDAGLAKSHGFKDDEVLRCFAKTLEAAQYEGTEPPETEEAARWAAVDEMVVGLVDLVVTQCQNVHEVLNQYGCVWPLILTESTNGAKEK